jgi:4-hydroxy-2-oxoheptanedioate aldolase
VVGHPHVEMENMERVVGEGYRFLMCTAPRNFGKLDKLRLLIGAA